MYFLFNGCNSNSNSNNNNNNSPSQNEGENEENNNNNDENQVNEEVPGGDEVVDKGENDNTNPDEPVTNLSNENKAMFVYFSATVHTEEVANMIASYINAPIHELVRVDPYKSEDLRYSDLTLEFLKKEMIQIILLN